FDFICCAVGTGGTLSGIINRLQTHQKALGFPALKGHFLFEEIRKYAKNDRWDLITDYHFGGYAKINEQLKQFMRYFSEKYLITLDPVYTSKLTFGVIDLISKGYFRLRSKLSIIHAGGLEGLQSISAEL